MSLVTRCPRCNTLYRVIPAQLQSRAGQVRCGRCMHVFDGFEALAVEQANAVSEPVRFEPETAEPAQPENVAAPDVAPAAEAPASPVFEAAPPAAPETVAPGFFELPAEPDAAPEPAPQPEPEPEILGPPKPGLRARMRTRAAARRRRFRERFLRKPSAAAQRAMVCLLLAALLAGQAAYAFRSPLAARYPGFKSAMLEVCEIAGCSVWLPHRPDLLQKVAEDVSALDTARPGLIQVTVTLRSGASHDLAYPALDLVLTNANEHALARRIFLPEEYLGRGADPRAGIPPKAEVTLALDLDTGNLNATGFRIDLLPAPAP